MLSQQTAYLGLGSNIGCREHNVFDAIGRFWAEGIGIVACSSLYESEPAEGVGGGSFINAVVEVRTLLQPVDLLNRLKLIEYSLGRTGGHNRPREIDIDIISFGDLVLESDNLTIPHPRYCRRAFVLQPLKDVAPDFTCPLTGRSIDRLLGALTDAQMATRTSSRSVIMAATQ